MRDDRGIEALERQRSVIARRARRDRVGEPGVAVEPALDFADDRDAAGDGVEQFAKARDFCGAGLEAERRESRRGAVRQRAARLGQPVERAVMEDHRFAVGAELNVAFDGEAAAECGLGRVQRVLDDRAPRVVQAAMGDRPRGQPSWRVRRHQATSNVASTSATALSGRWATPTVVRAWRPASPKISAIRSEAPFIACGRASNGPATLKKPPSRITLLIRSRSPSAALACASRLIAQSRAAARPIATSAPGPSLPIWAGASLPSRPIGNWPEMTSIAPSRA